MATLQSNLPKNTYMSLLKTLDNSPITTTPVTQLSDGLGNALPLRISINSVTNYGPGGLNSNTAFGDQSLIVATSGGATVAFGTNTLAAATNVTNTVAIGYYVLANYNGTGMSRTVAVGSMAALYLQSSVDNVSIGYYAHKGATAGSTGSRNVAIGTQTLNDNVSGASNVAVGTVAMRFLTSGIYNTAVGDSALYNLTTGVENIGIGSEAIKATTTASQITAVGNKTVSGNFSGSTILGYGATATGANQFVVGSAGTNAGAIDTAAVSATHRWKVKLNGTDYYIALQPA